jgi:hypothetical protein
MPMKTEDTIYLVPTTKQHALSMLHRQYTKNVQQENQIYFLLGYIP